MVSTGSERSRLTVALTFDHDAIASEVSLQKGAVAISRGEYGARVGVGRVLALLTRHRIAATFFVPAHTAITFPASVEAISAAGHELACHGWAHEDFGRLDEATERALLVRSRDKIADVWGRRPVGFRAPFWSVSERTLEIVEELGFRYDSSLMADDVRPYRVRHGDVHSASAGSTLGVPGSLVEVPVSRTLDDWPHFEPSRQDTGPMSAPSKVLEIWTDELRWVAQHEPGGVLTVTMHPEAIGRPSRIAMLERFIEFAEGISGVAFDRLDHAVDRWLADGAHERLPPGA